MLVFHPATVRLQDRCPARLIAGGWKKFHDPPLSLPRAVEELHIGVEAITHGEHHRLGVSFGNISDRRKVIADFFMNVFKVAEVVWEGLRNIKYTAGFARANQAVHDTKIIFYSFQRGGARFGYAMQNTVSVDPEIGYLTFPYRFIIVHRGTFVT